MSKQPPDVFALMGAPLTSARTLKLRRDPVPGGYVDIPGTGPEGETCRTCKHKVHKGYPRAFLKCALNSARWTNGRGTDILAKSPACRKWEARDDD